MPGCAECMRESCRPIRHYPFMSYGTDWLAFAHLIAVAFLGPLYDPVRNKWVLVFGVIACVGVLPLALIAGPIRGIPFYWRLIDSSFGVIGAVPLLICLHYVRQIEKIDSIKRHVRFNRNQVIEMDSSLGVPGSNGRNRRYHCGDFHTPGTWRHRDRAAERTPGCFNRRAACAPAPANGARSSATG